MGRDMKSNVRIELSEILAPQGIAPEPREMTQLILSFPTRAGLTTHKENLEKLVALFKALKCKSLRLLNV